MQNKEVLKRQSNIELLRLVAMFMILLLHANYMSFGPVAGMSIDANPGTSFLRIALEQMCIVGVNVYVLISGWFGIVPKKRRIVGLVLQVLTYSVLMLFVGLVFMSHLNFDYSLRDILVIGKPYWFVVSYFLLYILSPVLNAFVENATRTVFRNVLLAFFCFEFIYGWKYCTADFDEGYSTMSFVGLYLLARYLRLHGGKLVMQSKKVYFGGYMLVTLLVTLWLMMKASMHKECVDLSYTHYDCPFVVLSAVFFFLGFTRLSIESQKINYLSTSALAVYLVHCNPVLWNWYLTSVHDIYFNFPHFGGLLLVLLFIAAVFFVSLYVDKLRIKFTNIDKICELLERKHK